MSFNPSPLESGGEGWVYFCHFPRTHTPEQVGIFAYADKTLLETFWHTQA